MYKSSLFTLVGFVVSIGASAQTGSIADSLKSLLSKGVKMDELLPCLIEKAMDLVDRDNQAALVYIQQAEKLAVVSGDSLAIVKCLRISGQTLYRIGRADEAIQNYERGLHISRRNGFLEETLRLLTSYGVIYSYQSQFDKALKNFFDSYEIALILKDSIYVEMNQNNIGVVYYKLKDYRKALYYWTAASKSEKSRNEASFFKDMNISLAHANLREFEQARKALNESIRICGSSCPKDAFVHIKYASGCIYLGLNNLKKAEADFLESYDLCRASNNIRLQLDNIYLLAELYHKQDQPIRALYYLNEGEKLVNKKGVAYNLEIIKLYQRFSATYMSAKFYEKAAVYQAKYIQLRDSIYDERLTTSLMQIEAEHLEKTNAAKIEAQKEVIDLKGKMLARQLLINLVMTFLAIVIFGCCILLYHYYGQKRTLNQLLDEKIRQRTGQLERSKIELVKALEERELMIDRAILQVNRTVKTIEGLCFTGKSEIQGNIAQSYFQKIFDASHALKKTLNAQRHTSIEMPNDWNT